MPLPPLPCACTYPRTHPPTRPQPSKAAVFELLDCRFYKAPTAKCVGGICNRIDFPSLGPDAAPGDKIFVFHTLIPQYAPAMWGGATDGEGFSIVQIYRMGAKAVEQVGMEAPTLPWARVLKRFMEAPCEDVDTPTKKIHERLKLICRLANQEEVELGSFEKGLIGSYNAKPVLTRPQHNFYKGVNEHGVDYFEAVLDAHEFAFVAKKGLSSLLDRISDMVVDMSFTVEGHEDDELPETLLGMCRICKIDIEAACLPLPDVKKK